MKQFKKKEIIICSVLLIIFFLVFGVVLLDKNLVIDEAIYNFIMKSRCTFLDNYFTFIIKSYPNNPFIPICCIYTDSL